MIGSSKRPRRAHAIRWTCRWLVLAGAVALAWPWRSDSTTSVILPATSPFIAMAGAISTRTTGVLLLLSLPVFLLALRFPRSFCRYGCPVGLLQDCGQRLRPKARKQGSGWPAVGRWLLLLTLGGALLGWPLFLWLDPLALFNGFLNAWRQPLSLATLLTGLGLPLVLLFDLLLPALWCRRLCPLGATQDLLAWPRRALRRRQVRAHPAPTPWPIGNRGRRRFLEGLLLAGGAVAARAVQAKRPPLLRPPGSLDEGRFAGVCVRCGNCAQVCPSDIIQPDLGASGFAGFLSPRLRFDADYCREDCHRCGEVCPSGAITRLSADGKRRWVIGRAVVDYDRCLLVQGRECTACLQRCPYQAIAMRSADGGFSNEPAVIADRCNGCGACEAVCPTAPTRAIQVGVAARCVDQRG
ncbi:MAG: 4Fe-4S dicluster domain-containing protein [Verrucomicrobiales bacterium]|nr:4Fe-4S dicluster domain-containing protein [Verrucomicrobiales bacterium]